MRFCLRQKSFFSGTAALSLVVCSVGFSQTAPTVTQPPTSQASSDQAAFQQGQQALAQSLSALMAKGATPAQIQAWQQQNASQIAAQQQLAINMGEDSALLPMPIIAAPNIPANASQTLKDFLTAQVALANAKAQIHNQLISALPSSITEDQFKQMQENEEKLFSQQQGAAIQAQQQRAQALAAESAQQPVPLPPPLVIPPGTSSQLSAFLTARDQLMREEVQLLNQYATATPQARETALEQWYQQNASQFQQMQQLAQNLSSTPSN